MKIFKTVEIYDGTKYQIRLGDKLADQWYNLMVKRPWANKFKTIQNYHTLELAHEHLDEILVNAKQRERANEIHERRASFKLIQGERMWFRPSMPIAKLKAV